MKRVLLAIAGAVIGYVIVALTLGFVVDGALLAALYLLGMTAGIVVAVRSTRPRTQPE